MVLTAPGQHTASVAASADDQTDLTPGQEVLALLRDGSGRRPSFDPDLAGGMRAWLEDAAGQVARKRGEGPVLYLGSRLVTGEGDGPWGDGECSVELVTSCLVRALFRQIILTGSVGDPLGDAMDALAVEGGREHMHRFVRQLSAADSASLSSSVAIHAGHLMALTPRFAPGWLPRTNDRVSIPLAGGRVVLTGTFDLLVGAPTPGTASLCAVGVCTGDNWASARTALHFMALLETLRSGTPPFRVALLQSASGRYGVEDMHEEHLGAMVGQLAGRMEQVAVTDV
jgi:hypothetical protein